MFERFTASAIEVLQSAQRECHNRRHSEMEPEHLLFGLIAENRGLAGVVLRAENLTLEAASRIVSNLMQTGTNPA